MPMKAKIPWNGTKAQRKAMMDEINRQILEADAKYANDIDAMILYTLHVHLGFGKKRLRRFYEAFAEEHQRLVDHYQMPSDVPWVCDCKLKEIGVDVKQWNEEMKK
jgi:hypothetical protein